MAYDRLAVPAQRGVISGAGLTLAITLSGESNMAGLSEAGLTLATTLSRQSNMASANGAGLTLAISLTCQSDGAVASGVDLSLSIVGEWRPKLSRPHTRAPTWVCVTAKSRAHLSCKDRLSSNERSVRGGQMQETCARTAPSTESRTARHGLCARGHGA